MKLKYCVKCEQIISTEDTNEEIKNCHVCNTPLLYFGSENVSLSTEDVFAEYDENHPYQPFEDFSGYFFNLERSQTLAIDRLSCEDMLIHNEKDIDALYHLATSYKTNKEYRDSIYYFEKLIGLAPDHLDSHRHLADLYFYEKNYQFVIRHVTALINLNKATTRLEENLGICYGKLKNYRKAIRHFVNAYRLCKIDEKKQRIKHIISKLLSARR